ncbi:hypothetical protein LR48_Vigan04g153400 [Vigna angularis]|uniref:Uncharacterized protein n=1 Tax=Phaseolus angularis TaxID=3914 RepID=A0A0L9UF37_PHAAN|nr:hypothetical protein LR48_Vigan04g153400 [Vigna angularis]
MGHWALCSGAARPKGSNGQRWRSFAHGAESFLSIRLDFHLDGSKSCFHHHLGGCGALFRFSL